MPYVIPDLQLSIQTLLRKNGLRNSETSIAAALPFTLYSRVWMISCSDGGVISFEEQEQSKDARGI